MKVKTIWVLEYTMQTKVPILHEHQAAIDVQIYTTKESAEYHANMTTEQYIKKGWEVEDDTNGKTFHKTGCVSHGYRITEKPIHTM